MCKSVNVRRGVRHIAENHSLITSVFHGVARYFFRCHRSQIGFYSYFGPVGPQSFGGFYQKRYLRNSQVKLKIYFGALNSFLSYRKRRHNPRGLVKETESAFKIKIIGLILRIRQQ